MKPTCLFLLFIAMVSRGYSQVIDYKHLSPDTKDIAVQAFSKVGPETKKWFAEAAKQHPAGVFNESWAKNKLKERFSQDELDKVGNLFLLMMAYQRTLNGESGNNQPATGVSSSASRVRVVAKGKSDQSSQKIIRMKPMKIDTSKRQQKKPDFTKQLQQAEEDEKRSKEDKQASDQHRKNVRDSIQKLLDQLSKMGKNIKM
jgi:hypothetical protein